MKIGSTLKLTIEDPITNKITNCRCKIIGKNDRNIYIDYPINSDTSKTIYIPDGQNLTAIYMSASQGPLEFSTKIIKRVTLTVPALVIDFPNEHAIKRVQRREFVRIKTSIDVAVHSIDNRFEPFTTVTSDISGGGVSIILPSEETLQNEEKLKLWMVMPSDSGKHYYAKVDGKMIRMKILDNGIKIVSINFVLISNLTQQKVMRHCFEKQREARVKMFEA